jgi:hypothetical protein
LVGQFQDPETKIVCKIFQKKKKKKKLSKKSTLKPDNRIQKIKCK